MHSTYLLLGRSCISYLATALHHTKSVFNKFLFALKRKTSRRVIWQQKNEKKKQVKDVQK